MPKSNGKANSRKKRIESYKVVINNLRSERGGFMEEVKANLFRICSLTDELERVKNEVNQTIHNQQEVIELKEEELIASNLTIHNLKEEVELQKAALIASNNMLKFYTMNARGSSKSLERKPIELKPTSDSDPFRYTWTYDSATPPKLPQ